MLLTFEKIREVQLNERGSELQKIPEGFFRDALEYLKIKVDTEEGKTAQKILINLFERRLKKITNLASVYYSTGNLPDNLDPEEQNMYSEISSALKTTDSEFKKKLYNIRTLEIPKPENNPGDKEAQADADEINSAMASEEINTEPAGEIKTEMPLAAQVQKVKVKFTTDTPELMTPEMETCSFKKGQCIEIAKSFAEFLEKRGFCSIERA